MLEGKRINDLPPHKRNVNTVFQRYALFPHLNVYDNIAFGLRVKKLPEKEIPAPESNKIDSDDLRELVVKLTPEQMTAVYLHYYEGYSLKEIGKMCGTTAASVSMRLARARARLKTMLTEDDYE